jgi:hypothetical protein
VFPRGDVALSTVRSVEMCADAAAGGLVEYLYVDQRRLDSYFEQISSPVAYDKVPQWKIALGLGGPSVEGNQERPGRPFTTHEKLVAVLEYLRRTKNLLETPPLESPYDKFSLWAYDAQRFAIPLDRGQVYTWYATWAHSPENSRRVDLPDMTALFMLEDWSGPDTEPVRLTSTFSSFALKYAFIAGTRNRSDIDSGGRFANGGEAPDGNPRHFLEAMNAQPVGPRRRIEALTRLRSSCPASDEEGRRWWVKVAYPVSIVAAGL